VSIRVRFAPSPTGYMHIGNARTALFNWLFARKHEGVFILRIEDTDLRRHVEDAIDVITEGLSWLGMDWDEGPGVEGEFGPYYQSKRLELYREHARVLLEEQQAYICRCNDSDDDSECRCREAMSAADAEAPLDDGLAVRFFNPRGNTEFTDIVQGELSFENEQFGDFILIKSDGTPTYNFANVADDNAMQITHVARGDDHISNTPRQLMLYQAFGFEPPEFAHLPQIMAPEGGRMSKRHGASSLTELQEAGFLPEAAMNYLALLGWSPGDEREYLTTDKLIEEFELGRVNKSPAQFNMKRLVHINSLHMEQMPLQQRAELAADILTANGLLSSQQRQQSDVMDKVRAVVDALGSRFKYGEQILEYGEHFFSDSPPRIDPELYSYLAQPQVRQALSEAGDRLKQLPQWTIESIEKVVRTTADEHDLKAAPLIHAIRVSLSGSTVGPGLFILVRLVGQDESYRRIQHALEHVPANNEES